MRHMKTTKQRRRVKPHSVEPVVRRIYCRFCGAKLRSDAVGLYCPTDNCQWRYGLPTDEPGALRNDERDNCKPGRRTIKLEGKS